MPILNTISLEPMHGCGICERIQRISDPALTMNGGSLCALLHGLTREVWIRSYRRTTVNNRRARHFHLTRAAEKQLAIEAERRRCRSTAVTPYHGNHPIRIVRTAA